MRNYSTVHIVYCTYWCYNNCRPIIAVFVLMYIRTMYAICWTDKKLEMRTIIHLASLQSVAGFLFCQASSS